MTISITKRKPAIVAAVMIISVTGCGLGMSDEDRLDRATDALARQEYQAAIVDAKDVLRGDANNVRARKLLGVASLEVGDVAAAEKEFERALELGAGMSELIVPWVSALVGMGKYQEALDVGFDDSLADEGAATLRRLRGDAMQGLQRPSEARGEYEAALVANSNDVLAHLGVSATYLAEGNAVQARNNLDVLVGEFPENPRVWLASADLHRFAGATDQASSHYQQALETSESEPQQRIAALSGLAETALSTGDVDKGREYVEQLSAVAPDALLTKIALARLAIVEQDWTTAQSQLQDVLRRAPDFRPAQMLLGAVAYEAGSYEQAEMYLSAVVANDPENVNARLMLAEVFIAAGQPDDARRVLAPLEAEQNPDPRVTSIAAKIALSAGETDRAIHELRRSVAADPTNIATHLQLSLALIGSGRQEEVADVLAGLEELSGESTAFQRDILAVLVQLRDGRAAEAKENAMRIVSEWPDQSGSHNLVGAIELADNNFARAKASFLSALAVDPDNPATRRFLAQIAERQQEYAEAAERYEQIAEDDSSALWAMHGRARVAVAQQDFGTAAKWLERVVAGDPETFSHRETLVLLHAQNDDLEAARTVAQDMVALDKSRTRSYLILGGVAVQAEDYAAAIDAFEEAQRLDPSSMPVRLRLADAQRLSGDVDAAMQTLGGDGTIDYSDLQNVSAMALQYAGAGNFERSKEIVAGLRQSHPDSSAPLALEGEVWLLQGDLYKASASYEKAIEKDMRRPYVIRQYSLLSRIGDASADQPLIEYLDANPDDVVVRRLIAQHKGQAGSAGEAIEAYERALESNPNDGISLNNLAWMYYEQGDDRAISTARRAREALPANWSVLDTLGWILVEAGQLEEGRAVLTEAAELAGGQPIVRYHLAEAHARSGDTRTAKQILEELLAEDNEFSSRADAERLLAGL